MSHTATHVPARGEPLVKQDGNMLSSTVEEKAAASDETQPQPPEADVSKVMKAPPAKRLKQSWLENPFQFYDTNEPLQKDWHGIK